MSDASQNDDQSRFIILPIKKLVSIILVGLVSGILIWALTYFLDTYIYKGIFCNGERVAQCASSNQYAATTALIISAIISLLALIKLHVYRPLLVVLATYISIWGLVTLASPLSWYVSALAMAVFTGLALGLYAWLARIRKFIFAIIAIIVVVVLILIVRNS